MKWAPEGFGPEFDRAQPLDHDEEAWSESYAFWADYDDGYVYAHFQRHPQELDMWRGYVVALGEDGSVTAFHSFGRSVSDDGPGYQQLHGKCIKPFEKFALKADAVGQVSTRAQLRENSISSYDENTVPLSLDLVFDSVGPTYAPMSHMAQDDGGHSNAKWTHFTPCAATGDLRIGEKSYKLDATTAWRDHSAGPRQFGSMGDGFMLLGQFPSGRNFMAIGIGTITPEGEFMTVGVGGVTVDGKMYPALSLKAPERIHSFPIANDELGTLEIETEFGVATVKVKTTNAGVPFALLPPNFEAIGLPDGADTRLVYHEHHLELEWGGEAGTGKWEPCRLKE